MCIYIYIYISTEPESKMKASETGHTLQRAVVGIQFQPVFPEALGDDSPKKEMIIPVSSGRSQQFIQIYPMISDIIGYIPCRSFTSP